MLSEKIKVRQSITYGWEIPPFESPPFGTICYSKIKIKVKIGGNS